jgi:TolB-like protein
MFSRRFAVSLSLAACFAAAEARAEERAPVIAVFEIQDTTKRPKRLPAGLTDYLRVKLAETRLVKVVDKGDQENQLKKLIKAERKSSYQACVDEACQIPLGKELAADKILRGKITRFGKAFVLAVEMVDLASGASAGAASDKNDGTEEGLMASVEKVAAALTADLRARSEAAAMEAAKAREAEQAQLVKAEAPKELNMNAAPAPPPTQAKVVVDDGPSGGELALIIGGWSVFGIAYLGEILINLIAADITGTYYAFIPIAGPIFIELVNKNIPGYEAKPINYVAAGVQALGAGIAVLGHVLAATPDKKPGQASLTAPGDIRVSVVFGLNHLGIVGTF